MELDYKLLRALSVVVETQSFERAADKLCISQSAVSQRIKLLEEFVGHPVLIRGKPIVTTTIGQQMLVHANRVQQLEDELLPKVLPDTPLKPTQISISINADSLAIWFLRALSPLLKSAPVELNIIISDESRTLEKLKTGEAYAAVSSIKESLPGFSSWHLGKMKYMLVASPAFIEQHFVKGVNGNTLMQAPAVAFDHLDDMHHRYVEQHFQLKPGNYPCHIVRSSEAFVEMAKQGLAYSLIPELQIEEELKSNTLVNLMPGKELVEDLYWHSWVLEKGVFKQVSELIVKHGRNTLSH